ncbi:MAG: hypothetical protein SangKO_016830 [Sandaracinaceae bacterium]
MPSHQPREAQLTGAEGHHAQQQRLNEVHGDEQPETCPGREASKAESADYLENQIKGQAEPRPAGVEADQHDADLPELDPREQPAQQGHRGDDAEEGAERRDTTGRGFR